MDVSGQKYSVSTGCLPWSQQHAPLQSHSHRKNQARATLKFLVGYSLQFPALTEVGDHHCKSHPRLVILIVLTNHQHNLEIKTKQHFKKNYDTDTDNLPVIRVFGWRKPPQLATIALTFILQSAKRKVYLFPHVEPI